MVLSVETAMTVALFFAIFAAVASIGSSLVLGVGFERLRNGFEILKKQSQFFGTAIHYRDERTENLERRMDRREGDSGDPKLKALEEKMARYDGRRGALNEMEKVKVTKTAHDYIDLH
jgi:sugar (pentulose or hexulose) kinase